MGELIIVSIMSIPFILTAVNVFQLFKNVKKGYIIASEAIGLLLGTVYLEIYISLFNDVAYVMWDEVIYSNSKYPPIDISRAYQLIILFVLGFVGWGFLRFCPIGKQPPLLTALAFAFVYLMFIELIICMVQIFDLDKFYFISLLFPFNFLIIVVKLIREQILFRKDMPVKEKWNGVRNILTKSYSLPILGFVLLFGMIGALLIVLIIFGQSPDEITKVWTNTAEWTFSQQTPPPKVPYDGHYLCTVAANGHQRIVKPIRTGKRQGHTILVNRQLMIANAFEDLIKERTPKFHRIVRNFYDKTGFPISRHITTKIRSDLVYFMMKPLEWCFLIVLYLFDSKPENRIAVQYLDRK